MLKYFKINHSSTDKICIDSLNSIIWLVGASIGYCDGNQTDTDNNPIQITDYCLNIFPFLCLIWNHVHPNKSRMGLIRFTFCQIQGQTIYSFITLFPFFKIFWTLKDQWKDQWPVSGSSTLLNHPQKKLNLDKTFTGSKINYYRLFVRIMRFFTDKSVLLNWYHLTEITIKQKYNPFMDEITQTLIKYLLIKSYFCNLIKDSSWI